MSPTSCQLLYPAVLRSVWSIAPAVKRGPRSDGEEGGRKLTFPASSVCRTHPVARDQPPLATRVRSPNRRPALRPARPCCSRQAATTCRGRPAVPPVLAQPSASVSSHSPAIGPTRHSSRTQQVKRSTGLPGKTRPRPRSGEGDHTAEISGRSVVLRTATVKERPRARDRSTPIIGESAALYAASKGARSFSCVRPLGPQRRFRALTICSLSTTMHA